MIFGCLDGGGAPPDTERAIPGSDLFRVSAGNGESPCTCLGVIADQVVTAGPGYGVSPVQAYPAGRSTSYGGQVFHLVFGEAEMDEEGPDLGHGADRDSYFLAAPHVPLLEEHVGYLVAARFHDQPLELPYVAVGRTDGQFAVYFYLAGWDGVDGDLLRGLRCVRVADRPDYAPNAMLLLYPCMRVLGGVEARHRLGLLGGPERLELG